MSPDRVRDLLLLPTAVCVLLGWVTSLVYALLENEFTPLTLVTPAFLGLGGFMFGSAIVKRALRGDD